jgi:hypothetical protein
MAGRVRSRLHIRTFCPSPYLAASLLFARSALQSAPPVSESKRAARKEDAVEDPYIALPPDSTAFMAGLQALDTANEVPPPPTDEVAAKLAAQGEAELYSDMAVIVCCSVLRDRLAGLSDCLTVPPLPPPSLFLCSPCPA